MAQLIRTDGTMEPVSPTDGKQWTESDLKTLIGGDYNVSRIANGDYLLHLDRMECYEKHGDSVTFEQLCRWRPFNPTAAKLTGYEDEGLDWVFGDALLVPQDDVPLTPQNKELFGDWGEDKTRVAPPVVHEYCCTDDECGIVFNYGHPGLAHHPPAFCPLCGEESPVRIQSITHKNPKSRTKVDKALPHIDALMQIAGLDRSEGATAMFVEMLDTAVIMAREAWRESTEKQGLSLDCRFIIAETLANWNETVSKSNRKRGTKQ